MRAACSALTFSLQLSAAAYGATRPLPPLLNTAARALTTGTPGRWGTHKHLLAVRCSGPRTTRTHSGAEIAIATRPHACRWPRGDGGVAVNSAGAAAHVIWCALGARLVSAHVVCSAQRAVQAPAAFSAACGAAAANGPSDYRYVIRDTCKLRRTPCLPASFHSSLNATLSLAPENAAMW